MKMKAAGFLAAGSYGKEGIHIARLEKLNAELEKARQKAVEWQARAKDLERQVREQENLEIIQAVRGVTASPEELRDILAAIQAMQESPAGNNHLIKKEETGENEEN